MGYVHSWANKSIPPATWAKIKLDSEKLIKAYGAHRLRDVSLTGNAIFLNGECESFYLQRRSSSGFCKTNGHPYDQVVCAILSVAQQHSPTLRISSDAWMGDKRDRWLEAAAWATQVLNRPVPAPPPARELSP
jgi:hypothetical protein